MFLLMFSKMNKGLLNIHILNQLLETNTDIFVSPLPYPDLNYFKMYWINWIFICYIFNFYSIN